ncbi:CSLREA domain-containing protein [Wenzhouxiangella marina]|uniref:Uncharacterized protein n=1 Tax=Wenzhouxiangella marina TaxID=1579979 RepID=A0A0K0XS99_9GAMM|nr:CSLREA domain-containing protein [Wenzhouxiangella marina]AKS40563.1 hypothetical protein WM2015_174 [Wenzhouxiangella marina]MBB6088331.1 CSLREA domain-containing protein [Wenzhouxiangella marina]
MHSIKYQVQERMVPTVAPLTAAIGLALSASTLQAATITVTTLADGSVPGQCTLRDALASANGDSATAGCASGSGADEIVFQPGLNGTITLAGVPLPIISDLSITGPGPGQLTISGNNAGRAIVASGAVSASISGVRLVDGTTNDTYGGSALVSIGANVSLSNCEISNNSSGPNAYGGAITSVTGILSIDDCLFYNNEVTGGMAPRGSANAFGGAVLAVNSQVTITGSSFQSNNASAYGGAIALVGSTASITSSSFLNNSALFGGAISVGGLSDLSLNSSAITSNFALAGGGLVVGSQSYAELIGSTIDSNEGVYTGGGIQVGIGYPAPTPIAAGAAATADSEQPFGAPNFSLTGPGNLLMSYGYIADNSTEGKGGGLGAKYESTVDLTYSDVVYNVAEPLPVVPRAAAPFGDRGAAQPTGQGGGVSAIYGAEINGPNNVLSNNTAIYGGAGFAHQYGAVLLDSSIISGNAADLGGGLLGGFFPAPVMPREESPLGGGPSYNGVVGTIDSVISGNSALNGGGVSSIYGGAAVVKYSDVLDNIGSNLGGGVLAYEATLLMVGGQVRGNTAYQGGGLLTRGNPNEGAIITQSTISSNSANLVGGIFMRQQNQSLKYSTVTDNTATVAGGLAAIGLLGNEANIFNSTITNNTANTAGGLYVAYTELDFLTVSHNTATGGAPRDMDRPILRGVTDNPGGGYLVNGSVISNSIFGDNLSPGGTVDLAGAMGATASVDYSLIETPGANVPAGTGNVIGLDPQLGILAANGGATLTRAIGSGSPAFNAANPATSVEFDQRGDPFPRVFAGRADMGAFEFVVDGIFQDRFEQP